MQIQFTVDDYLNVSIWLAGNIIRIYVTNEADCLIANDFYSEPITAKELMQKIIDIKDQYDKEVYKAAKANLESDNSDSSDIPY